MKKLIFPALLLLWCHAHGEVLSINQFNGINTEDSPLALADGQTPDSQNVVTDVGIGIRPRLGLVSFSTETSRGLWTFGKTDGTRYLIDASSNVLKATSQNTAGANFTTTISTIAISTPTFGVTLGNTFYFMNTVDGLKAWDGSTTATIDSSKKGIAIASFKGRLALGGITGNERTLYLSRYLNGTDFTLPSTEDDSAPAQIIVAGALDEGIFGLYGTFQDKLMIFKPRSFQSLSGSRRSNFALRVHSDTVGLSNSESVQDCDGKLRWVSAGRSFYEFDGANLINISEKIKTLTDSISAGDIVTRSNTQTTQTDWDQPPEADRDWFDIKAIPGSMRMRFPDYFTTLKNGTNGTNNVWSEYHATAKDIAAASAASVSNGKLLLAVRHTDINVRNYFKTRLATRRLASGTTYHFQIDNLAGGATDTNRFYFGITPDIITAPNDPFSYSTFWWYKFTTNASGTMDLTCGNSMIGEVTPCSSTAVPMGYYYDFYLDSSKFQFTINGASVNMRGSTVFTVSTLTFAYMAVENLQSGGDNTVATIDNFSVTPQTATFVTQFMTVGSDITSWGPVTISSTISGGTIGYQFNASTQSDVNQFSSTGWTAVVNSGTPSNATNAYAAMRATFTTTAWNDEPQLDELTASWNVLQTIRMSSAYFNKRYWLNCAISSSANNTNIVYDRNNQWQKWTIPASAAVIHNSKLYVGSALGIFEAENGYKDNGNSIPAYYKTKTFMGTSPDLLNVYSKLRMTTDHSDETLATTYRMNGDDTSYSLGSYAMNQELGIENFKLPFSSEEVQKGRYIDFKWSVTGTTFWRILNGNLYFNPELTAE